MLNKQDVNGRSMPFFVVVSSKYAIGSLGSFFPFVRGGRGGVGLRNNGDPFQC